MLSELRPCFWNLCHSAKRIADLEPADLSARKTVDATGHPMGVGGVVVVERLEPDGSGSLMDWVVVSERTVDDNGFHSWSLLSGIPVGRALAAERSLPVRGLFVFMDLAGEAPTTPEASTWVMMLIGFAGVGIGRASKLQESLSPAPISEEETLRDDLSVCGNKDQLGPRRRRRPSEAAPAA